MMRAMLDAQGEKEEKKKVTTYQVNKSLISRKAEGFSRMCSKD